MSQPKLSKLERATMIASKWSEPPRKVEIHDPHGGEPLKIPYKLMATEPASGRTDSADIQLIVGEVVIATFARVLFNQAIYTCVSNHHTFGVARLGSIRTPAAPAPATDISTGTGTSNNTRSTPRGTPP
ncbi:MAG: hypothetical protein WDW38_006675 [Sanguina aurantia]